MGSSHYTDPDVEARMDGLTVAFRFTRYAVLTGGTHDAYVEEYRTRSGSLRARVKCRNCNHASNSMSRAGAIVSCSDASSDSCYGVDPTVYRSALPWQDWSATKDERGWLLWFPYEGLDFWYRIKVGHGSMISNHSHLAPCVEAYIEGFKAAVRHFSPSQLAALQQRVAAERPDNVVRFPGGDDA